MGGERHPHRGAAQRRGVVGAVANHEHPLPRGLETLHGVHLVLGQEIADRLADPHRGRHGADIGGVIAREEHAAPIAERVELREDAGEPVANPVGVLHDAGRPVIDRHVGAEPLVPAEARVERVERAGSLRLELGDVGTGADRHATAVGAAAHAPARRLLHIGCRG